VNNCAIKGIIKLMKKIGPAKEQEQLSQEELQRKSVASSPTDFNPHGNSLLTKDKHAIKQV